MATQPRTRMWWVLAASVALVAIAALLGSLAVQANVDGWYADTARPPWTPPNWLFGPVWTLLYLAMAFAAWRVWRATDSPRRRAALWLYLTQLVLNTAWSPLFFGGYPVWGATALWVAAADIIVLAGLIAITIGVFHRVDRLAAYLLVPYLVWVLYAASINVGVAVLAS